MAVANRLCNLGAHLGLKCGPLERIASLELSDYRYPSQPTPQQQQLLMQQAALLASTHAAYQSASTAPGAPASNVGMPATYNHLPLSASALPTGPAGQVGSQGHCGDFLDSMLPLDLDDDCLKLMLGEEGDESNADDSSSQQGGDRRVTRSTAAAKAGAEQQQPQSSGDEEDDGVDLLFQDLTSLRHVASYGSLDLDVLSALQQDLDTASSGDVGAAGAGEQKRARGKDGRPAPHLMLQMNYASAAETINTIIEADRKVAALGLDEPGSPGSAASAGTQELERTSSCGKRKRA